MSCPNILDLSATNIIHSFSFLKEGHLHKIQRTCHEFHDLAQNAVISSFFQSHEPVQVASHEVSMLERLQTHHPSLKRLFLELHWAYWDDCSVGFPNLRQTLEYFPCLQVFQVQLPALGEQHSEFLETISNALPNLAELTLFVEQTEEKNAFINLTSLKCPTLTSFKLKFILRRYGDVNHSKVSLNGVLNNHSNLSSIWFQSGILDVDSLSTADIIYKNITEFTLDGLEWETEKQRDLLLPTLGKCFPNLRKLTLDLSRGIHVGALFSFCPHVEWLSLAFIDLSKIIGWPSQMERVISLKLSGFYADIPDGGGFADLLHRFPNLVRLVVNVRDFDRVYEDVKLQNLEELCVVKLPGDENTVKYTQGFENFRFLPKLKCVKLMHYVCESEDYNRYIPYEPKVWKRFDKS